METLTFKFFDSDILNEVTKRTSFLGKSRGTEQQAHLLDRLSLTEGENFLFSELLTDAITETYDWVKAFGRGVEDACVRTEKTLTIPADYTFTLRKTCHFDDNMEMFIQNNLRSAIVNYIIYRWFEYVFPDESKRFFDMFEDNTQKAKNALDSEDIVMERRYNLF